MDKWSRKEGALLMTPEEIVNGFTTREHVATRLMNRMKTNKGSWTTCRRNKILSKLATRILQENVFDWIFRLTKMVDPSVWNEDGRITLKDVEDELMALKVALQ